MKIILSMMLVSFFSISNAAPYLQPGTDSIWKVGIVPFTEPFVMQTSSTKFYGFDISVMSTLCQSLKKTCYFIPVKRSNLLSSLENNEIDVAIGAFVINAQMQQYVNFSIPYMISQARFVGLKEKENQMLTLETIRQMRVGVVAKSAYAIALAGMRAQRIHIFETDSDIIAAIKARQIDIGFINNYIANYWEHHSGDLIHPIGNPVNIGFGLGLILNRSQLYLLTQLNMAIYNYQNSAAFTDNYNMYLSGLEK